jgi:D-sedoheptulose 7-phosphate isomerase
MMSDLLTDIGNQLAESARIKMAIRDQYSGLILTTAELMIDCFRSGGKLLICGNGGSAADSQHFAAEMVGRLKKDRGALPAIALTTDTSVLTALANDYSYNHVFRKQIEALGGASDVLVGITTTGRSQNIVEAMNAAKALNMHTVALLGVDGGAVAELADHAIVIPSQVSQRIQEGHITIIHIWCDLIENALFPE